MDNSNTKRIKEGGSEVMRGKSDESLSMGSNHGYGDLVFRVDRSFSGVAVQWSQRSHIQMAILHRVLGCGYTDPNIASEREKTLYVPKRKG